MKRFLKMRTTDSALFKFQPGDMFCQDHMETFRLFLDTTSFFVTRRRTISEYALTFKPANGYQVISFCHGQINDWGSNSDIRVYQKDFFQLSDGTSLTFHEISLIFGGNLV